MNDLFSQIGIVAWGCKGGCRTFCDNRVVDVLALDIRTTLKDIRSFITISKPAMDFYAVEFTSQYKVFTQYRSSNDSGNGAFIAFTLLVPHKVKVQNIRTVLNEMMKDYFKEYMNPLTFSPLSGKYDDINKYISILRQHQSDIVPDNSHHYYAASVQDDRPRLVVYEDISAVDNYFESPYRPEFFSCQEVMFLSTDLYDNQTKYEVRFLVQPVVIAKVSEPIPESVVYPATEASNYKITSFTVNGVDYLGAKEKLYLPSEAKIDLSIAEEYYMPKNWVAVSAEQLVESGIFASKGRDFEFASHFELTPKRYFIKVINDDEHCDTRDLQEHLLLSDGEKRYPMSKLDNGEYGFLFAGKWVEKTYELEYYIRKFKEPADRDVTSLVKLEDIKPSELIKQVNPTLLLHVHEVVLRLEAEDKEPEAVNVIINSPSLKAPITLRQSKFKEKIVIALPSKGLKKPTFDIEADQFDTILEYDTYVLTPKFKVVGLKLQRQLREALGGKALDIQYKVKGQTPYEGVMSDGKYEFTLPYRWRNNMGALLIQGRPFGVTMDGNDMTFNSSILVNKTDKAIEVKCHQREGNDLLSFPMTLEGGDFLLFPSGTTFELSDDASLAYKTREYGYENGVYRVDVEAREMRATVAPVTPVEPTDEPVEPAAPAEVEPSKEEIPVVENPIVEKPEVEKPVVVVPEGEQPKDEKPKEEQPKDEKPKEEKKEDEPKPEPKPAENWVTLYDCEELYVHLKTKKDGVEFVKRVSELVKKSLQVTQNYFKIYNDKDKEICAVYFPKETYYQLEQTQEADNRKNGFEVKWTSDTECQITYKPMSFFSRLKGAIDKKWLFGMLAALVCLLGILGYFLFRTPPVPAVPQLVIDFSTKDNTKIERVETNLPGQIRNEGGKLIVERQEALPQDSLVGLAERTISVFFEGSDRDTFTVQEIPWPTGDPTDVEAFLGGKTDAGTIDVVILSPGEKMLQSLWEKFDAGACTIKECAEAAQKYKSQMEELNDIACELARADDFAKMEEFNLDGAIFAGTDKTQKLLADFNMKQGKQEVEAGNEVVKAGLKKQYDALITELGTFSCNASTVDRFEKFIKENADFNTPQARRKIEQYRLVLGYPDTGAIVSKLSKNYFSPKQWRLLEKYVISGYLDGKPIDFTALDKEYRESGGTY